MVCIHFYLFSFLFVCNLLMYFSFMIPPCFLKVGNLNVKKFKGKICVYVNKILYMHKY